MLEAADWRAREAEHQARADALSATHRARRSRGETHPIEDFLWTYYTISPGELRKWHPGVGASLEGAVDRETWRYYRVDGGSASVDLDAYFAKRGATVSYIEELLSSTLERTPQFGCFGLHEWAMVYRLTPEQIRHTRLPLRIGHEATDAVVESNPISCSHFDAYRFFTPAAGPLNKLAPTRENQRDTEQSACLHAGMDVYKWAGKLGPIIPGELLLDAFELARDIRVVDMQASPYDVSGFTDHAGVPLEPIAIETPEGKREYVRRQRGFAERGNALRARVLDAIAVARVAAGEA
ncbi:3-methyladenine DNA glycosylase [Leucobacter denitrificans]|uniref:3-methyladenine DNA glycosylase n=1 Tax=Leucobacter denitrificans TaxID=683042 RepID=A0A7G9S813_9MICO|nr:3-methyladenine DNA glycosylase [Leucobacter denitrificans]